MSFKGYSITALGSRETNQDSFLVNDEERIYAVADGIGGGMHGDVASKMAVEGLLLYPHSPTEIKSCFDKIQATIYAEAMARLGEPLMGTTLTALTFSDNEGRICHVGDSRAYLFRDGQLTCLTVDHELFDEAQQSSVLASYMGIPVHLHPIQIDDNVLETTAGDRLLICSDGLYRQVTEQRIVEVIQIHHFEPEKILETLVEEAISETHSDNVTIVYVEVS